MAIGETSAQMALRDPDIRLMLRVRDDDAGRLRANWSSATSTGSSRVMHHLVGNADEAEDLAQEVFLRVYRTRKKYTPKAKFSTWLFTIANNLALNALRDRQRKPVVPLDVRDSGPLGPRPAEQLGRGPRRAADARPAAAGTGRRDPPGARRPQRTAAHGVVLNKFEDMNYAEIAEVMGLTTKAVKSLLSRARANLREALAGLHLHGRRTAAGVRKRRRLKAAPRSNARRPMADEPLPVPDDAPPADPFEAELVAYLDGELDPAAARKVEKRLATDPAARAKATALKKTYDLLDYLPQPEPSATFTTRTLDKIPAVKSGSLPVPIPEPARTDAATSGTPGSATISSSVPVPLASGTLRIPFADRYPRWVIATGAMVALIAIGSIGYLGLPRSEPAIPRRSRRVRPGRMSFHCPITGSSKTSLFMSPPTTWTSCNDSRSQNSSATILCKRRHRARHPFLPPSRTIPPVPPSICGPRHSRHCHRPDRTRSVSSIGNSIPSMRPTATG